MRVDGRSVPNITRVEVGPCHSTQGGANIQIASAKSGGLDIDATLDQPKQVGQPFAGESKVIDVHLGQGANNRGEVRQVAYARVPKPTCPPRQEYGCLDGGTDNSDAMTTSGDAKHEPISWTWPEHATDVESSRDRIQSYTKEHDDPSISAVHRRCEPKHQVRG